MQAAVEAAQATRQASREIPGNDIANGETGQPAPESPAAPGAEPVTEPLPVLQVALAAAADARGDAAATQAGTADVQATAAMHGAAAGAAPQRQTGNVHGDAADPDLIVLPERTAVRAGSAAPVRPPARAGQPMTGPVIGTAGPFGGAGPRAAGDLAATDWWVQQRPRHRVPAGLKYVVAGLAAAIVLVMAAAAGFALSSHRAQPPSSRGPGTVRQNPAAAARAMAAAWVERQVSHAAVVSCDRVMCAALAADGFPAGRLRPIGSGARLLARSEVVVATPAVRRQFGGKLGTLWAPAVIARFGSSAAEVDIRIVAPHGAHAYVAALSGDQALRKAAGTALLGSRQIIASPTARRQLAAGEPDARLLIVITALAAQQPVRIEGFGNPGPRAGADVPLRYADLAEAAAGSRVASASYVHSVLMLLRTQHAPYRPARIQTVRLASGRLVLRICFLAPSPLGMFGPQSP